MRLSIAVFSVFVAIGAVSVQTAGVPGTGRSQVANGGAPALLTRSHLSLKGCFLFRQVGSGQYTTDYPVTYHLVDGARRYLQVTGDGHIYESTQPALLPCSTTIASLNEGALVADYGLIPNLNGSQQNPGFGDQRGVIRGIWCCDPVNANRGVINWSGSYTSIPAGLNSFAVATFDFTRHTIALNGCYAYPKGYQPYTGMGTFEIPGAYVSANLDGTKRWALTGGILASATSGNEYGPSIRAIPPPPDNRCAAGADNPLPAAGIVLASFAPSGNSKGPVCHTDDSPTYQSGSALGCDPGSQGRGAPTTPYPARLAFLTYSYDLYHFDWDPWPHPKPTTGYFGDYTSWRANWYRDISNGFQGYVVPYTQTSGWLKTTVVSSSRAGQVRIASTDMHDGHSLNLGDWFSVQTCRTGVDPGCSSQNANNMSAGIIDTIDRSTGDITYHVTSSDGCSSGCTHAPIVGGHVFAGPHYKSSIPGWPRSVLRMQLWDVNQFTTVLRGGKPWEPTFNEDFSLYAMGVTNLGDPSAGRGIQGGTPNGPRGMTVTSTMVDATNREIVVAISYAKVADNVWSMGIVLGVK